MYTGHVPSRVNYAMRFTGLVLLLLVGVLVVTWFLSN